MMEDLKHLNSFSCSIQCCMFLALVFPEFVPEVLGVEKYKMSWQVVLESLQDPHINRWEMHSPAGRAIPVQNL